MTVDAACASSLVSLALAASALQAGQIDMAIVGGASYNKCDSLILFSQAQSCSASGTRPFDASADGLVSAEGYVALVIKTLDRAIADGDSIQAVIQELDCRATGVVGLYGHLVRKDNAPRSNEPTTVPSHRNRFS